MRTKMLTPHPMTNKNGSSKVVSRWPIVLMIFGGILTVLWLVLLILYPLHLLQLL